MDIYSKKSNLKLVLLLIATALGLLTLVYTNYLSNRIAREEKFKARLWAEAISSKAQLVRYTNNLFTRLQEDERKKVNVWARSTAFLVTVDNNEELTFFTDIVTGNNEIPVIWTDENGKIIDHRNFDFLSAETKTIDAAELASFRIYPPIVINILGKRNYVYYRDSNLFSELKKTLNEIISSFINEVVVNTASAPVIMTDSLQHVKAFGNIDSAEMLVPARVSARIADMSARHEPIVVDLGEGGKQFIYYDDSHILKQLRIFPFIQLGIFALFLLFSYLAFSNSRKAEQNMVWVGMAKETAHQLGTPISSLGAWIDYLRDSGKFEDNDEPLKEMEHDVSRLELVADRFSKIGSVPQLEGELVRDILQRNIDYMQKRSSSAVEFSFEVDQPDLSIYINRQLFDWVLENLLKNALDAMAGTGSIHVKAVAAGSDVWLDIADTGCGIPRNRWKTIFEPGYSTKRRGWGLGLSLTRRIVEHYHRGKIFVKQSDEKGTTFRIVLPRA
ncbi:MAG: HAMP domain-containing sensor histidine kinase [Chitinophagales bacterium]